MRLIRLAVVLALSLPALAHAIDPSSPFSPAHRTLGRATLLIVDGKYSPAEPLVREALALDPTLREGHYNLGVILRNTGRPMEAIDSFRTALGLYATSDEPNRAKCLYGIALAAEDTGDPALAANAWRHYIAFEREVPGRNPVIEIARAHLAGRNRIKIPGTQKATR